MDSMFSDLPAGWLMSLDCKEMWVAPPVWMFEYGKASSKGMLLQLFWILKNQD